MQVAVASKSFSSAGQVHAGIAFVKVLRGRGLINLDGTTGLALDKPDPYVKISTGYCTAQTKVINDNLNPNWNEMLQLNINDVSAPIELEVWDKDCFSKDDSMGRSTISLQGLVPNEPKTISAPLGIGKGAVDIDEVTWMPLKRLA